jgi:hypothetical protein
MSSCVARVLFVTLLAAVKGGKNFLGTDPKLQAKLVRQELQGVLSEVLGHGHGVDAVRLAKIRESLAPIFRALPKNKQGRVSAAVMRYSVQRYFSQQHGWIVKGFEPYAVAANISDSSDNVVQSKLPDYIRTALEERFSHSGFSLEDLAVMVAAVERLTYDEVIRGVELAFELNQRKVTDGLDLQAFSDVLGSYLITEMLEGTSNELMQHREDKANIRELYPHWDTTFSFMMDLVQSEEFGKMHTRNPFTQHDVYFFDDATTVGQRISEQFGSWSNHECHEIKDGLVTMDPHGTGRVKLSAFYGKSENGGWQFREASEYLRQLGALDESSSLHGPQVIIPNYVSGMSNCITSAPYYSICCLNECDRVFQHLEAMIPASAASPADIIAAVESMPEVASIETGKIGETLRSRLEEVASVHGGKVPIHGRLLAQWLHFAFPRDCPFPHLAGTVNPQTPMKFEEVLGEDATTASDEEVAQFLKAEAATVQPSPDAGVAMWNLKEHILEASTPSDLSSNPLKQVLRTVSSLGLLATLMGLLFKTLMPQVLSISGHKAKAVEYDV